jgi:hypothetical protein
MSLSPAIIKFIRSLYLRRGVYGDDDLEDVVDKEQEDIVDSGSEEEDCKCQNCTLNIESGREQTKED